MTVSKNWWMQCIHILVATWGIADLLLAPTALSATMDEDDAGADPAVTVTTVVGNRAEMPCELTKKELESVFLVLWFKKGNETPIYTYDVRNKTQGRHRMNEKVLGQRAYFHTSTDPPMLSLDNIKETDDGLYQCRVDFRRAPTRYYWVGLEVIVPPGEPQILNADGSPTKKVIGPFLEGQSVTLSCEVTGGKPTPYVSWWQGKQMLDDDVEEQRDGFVKNDLRIPAVYREDLLSVLTCLATNNNISEPRSAAVSLDLTLKPLTGEIIGADEPFSAGRQSSVVCQSAGSKPSPSITWYKDGAQFTSETFETMSADGNVTSSTLTFVPQVEDNGKTIKCLIRNEEVEHVVIEDSKKLDVHYVPKVSFLLGSKLDPTNIKVGDDVYFDCSIDANPPVFKTFFSHDGNILERGEGVVITNQTLVLQKIQRGKTGSYRCHAQNSQGEGQSDTVPLLVKYAPVCKENQQVIYGVALTEKVEISCQVEAEPAPLSFRWAFNISSEVVDVPEGHQTRPDPSTSVVSYEPQTEFDYGTLLCWATNPIANQQTPCVFHILQTGPPEPLINCNFANQTPTSLKVECQEGFDGGLPQFFIMELYTSEEKTLSANLTSARPLFNARGLQDGISYTVVLYAANNKGRSVKTTLETRTPKIMDVKKLDSGQGLTSSDRLNILNPTVAAVIGAICLILVGLMILLVVVTVRRCRPSSGTRTPKIVSSSQLSAGGVYKSDRPGSDDDRSHDVIPLKAGTLLRVKGSDLNQQVTQVKTVTLGPEYSVLPPNQPGSCATLPFPVSSRAKSLTHIPEQIDYQLPPLVPDVDPSMEMGGYIYGNDQMWLKDHEPLSPPESFLTPGETTLTAGNHAQHHQQRQHQHQHHRQQQPYHQGYAELSFATLPRTAAAMPASRSLHLIQRPGPGGRHLESAV